MLGFCLADPFLCEFFHVDAELEDHSGTRYAVGASDFMDKDK